MNNHRKGIPIQSEDDRTFARIVSDYGDKTALASLIGTSESTVSQWADPDNTTHRSAHHTAKRYLWSLQQIDPEKEQRAWDDITSSRGLWKQPPPQTEGGEGAICGHLGQAVATSAEKVTHFITAAADGYTSEELRRGLELIHRHKREVAALEDCVLRTLADAHERELGLAGRDKAR